METTIIMAKSIKEAKEISFQNYGKSLIYVKPYRYASRGNNFYEFRKKTVSEINEEVKREYPIQDAVWPSRRWNKEQTSYCDLSGENYAVTETY